MQYVLYGIILLLITLMALKQPENRVSLFEKVIWVASIVITAYYEPTISILLSSGLIIRVLSSEKDYFKKAFQNTEKFEESMNICPPKEKESQENNQENQKYVDEMAEMAGITDTNLQRIQGEFVENETRTNLCNNLT